MRWGAPLDAAGRRVQVFRTNADRQSSVLLDHHTTMKPKSAKKEFEKFISDAGNAVASLTPEQAVSLVLDFYGRVRAEDCPLEEDGDMLLYQWGVYQDTGGGKSFHFDLTRQFMLADSDSDEGMSQLSLTLHFRPTPELQAIGDSNEWCHSPDKLAGFREFIRNSETYRAVTQLKPTNVKIQFSPI